MVFASFPRLPDLSRSSVAGLLISAVVFAPWTLATPDLWSVDIDNDPAPPPSQRPPFSRSATVDPSLLVYQIPGIVGGYLGFVLILAFALLTFGRRMRREAQASSRSLSMEMVKPLKRALDPSPISPSDSTRNWWKRGNTSQKGTPSTKTGDSPPQQSILSFDDKVIEKDKAQRQEEMERLYAAVMSEDTRTPRPPPIPQPAPQPDMDVPAIRSPTHVRHPSSSSRSFSQRQPPQVRATSPSDSLSQAPTYAAPFAPIVSPPPAARVAEYSANNSATQIVETGFYPQPLHSNQRPVTPPRPHLPASPRSGRDQPTTYTHSRQSSVGSTKSRSGRSNVRNLQISAPMPIPARPVDQYMEPDERAPLSPHYIPSNPPPPPSPPGPGDSRPQTPIEDDEDDEYGEREERGRTRGSRERPPYYSETRERGHPRSQGPIIHAYGGDDIEEPRPLPRAAPQRGVPSLTLSPPKATPQASTSTLNVGQQSASPVSAGAVNNPLPFRSYNNNRPLPPTSPTKAPAYQAFSPGPTKTTFLSPRRDRFLPGGMNAIGPGGIPNSAALLSAGLATPYSPYMPFSPMTPVTPHLTNRRERKAREREGGRVIPTAEDKVQDDKDLWGDGW